MLIRHRISAKARKSPRVWTHQFFDFTTIEANSSVVPGRIDSDAGRRFAALNMMASDLRLALSCPSEANKIGIPDPENIHSRALIHSAVTSYARPFKTSVREIQLSVGFFSPLGAGFDVGLHDYLAHPIHEGLAAWTIWGEDAGCRGVFFTASGHGT